MYNANILDEDIKITADAIQQLGVLVNNSGDDRYNAIRVYVSGGGCNGMEYGMTFGDVPNITDKVRNFDEHESLQLFVDVVAMEYLKGCEIDFVMMGLNASFVFNNVFKSVGGAGTCGACGAAAGTGCG